MKKVRVLVIVISLALMVMGIGYSTWSQKLDISVGGTLGKFDVNVLNAYAVNAAGETVRDTAYAYADYLPKEVTLTANKLIPGAYRDFVVFFKNDGDAPAVLTRIDFVQTLNADVLNQIYACVDGQWVQLDTTRYITLSKSMNPGEFVSIDVRIQLDKKATNDLIEKPFKFSMAPTFEQP